MSASGWTWLASAPPDPPELPEGLNPRWPAWSAPVALVASFFAISFALSPLLPLFLLAEIDAGATLGAGFLLLAIVVQDAAFVGMALAFATIWVRPQPWHFGLRATRAGPTIGWAALALGALVAFEFAYFELLGVDEGNVDDLGADEGLLAALAVALAVIVVAPVTEEFFFRGFFYRALRTRLRVPAAASIDGVVFGALHFEGFDTALALPVIALYGAVACLVYEHTGSLFSVIAIHAAFNTLANSLSGGGVAVSVVVGVTVVVACVLVPRRLGHGPPPFRGAAPRRRRAASAPATA
jgi:membrane protease YdiL (CAAX protease family)